MSDQQPTTATTTTTTSSPAQTALSETISTLELAVAHHENILYGIQATLTTLLPVTQQTTLNVLSSIENAAQDLWTLKADFERANVALLQLRINEVRADSDSHSEELERMERTAELLSRSLRWAEEFRLELGRRTDAVYFAAGDLEGVEVGEGDGESEVIRGARVGLVVVGSDAGGAGPGASGSFWEVGGSEAGDGDEGEGFEWDLEDNVANMI